MKNQNHTDKDCEQLESLNTILDVLKTVYKDQDMLELKREECRILIRVPEANNKKIPSYVVIVTVIDETHKVSMEADYYRLPTNVPTNVSQQSSMKELQALLEAYGFMIDTFRNEHGGLKIVGNMIVAHSDCPLPVKKVKVDESSDNATIIDNERLTELRIGLTSSLGEIIDLFRLHLKRLHNAKNRGLSFNTNNQDDKE